MMNPLTRTFIAWDLPEEVRERLKDVQKHFQTAKCLIKWVEPKNLHLTLKFLGGITNTQIRQVQRVLQYLSTQTPCQSLTLKGLDVFPNLRKPRVFIARLDDHSLLLKSLVERIEHELSGREFAQDEREFKAHITLGRFKSLKNRDVFCQQLQDFALDENIVIPLTQITLLKSTLTSSGPVYEIIGQYPLQQKR